MTDFKTKMAELAAKYNIPHKRDIDWHNFVAEVEELTHPELKESEDERIIKFLKHAATLDAADELFQEYGVKHTQVIAWLEKQKEQKPAERSEDTLDEFTENIRSLITRKFTYHDPNGSGISSTVFIDDETAKDIANGVLFYVGKEAVKNPHREIPEWSEVELEFRGEKVKVKRPFFRDDKGRGYSTTEQDEDVAWYALRAWCEKKGVSLYDLYPRTEWSEEDEKKINFLSRLIEFQVKDDEYCFGDGRLISKQEAIEMLKSLRPSKK